MDPHRWSAIADFVHTCRLRARITIETLAAATELPTAYLERLESGAVFPPVQAWKRLGIALGFDPADGIRIAAASVPPLTPESEARVRAAIRTRSARHRAFLQERRDAAGLTIEALADATGISTDDLEAIESAGDILPPHALQRIGAVLGFTAEDYVRAVTGDDHRAYGA